MKIVRKDLRTKRFKDLAVGDVFVERIEDNDEFIQMKIIPLHDANTNTLYNAVSLKSGAIYDMTDDTEVELVYATLTIE